MIKYFDKRGQSVFEYMALTLFVLGAFLVFQKYIVRGVSGRQKGVGDSFGYGRQYDPNETTECAYDVWFETGWYSQTCFEENCIAATCDLLSTRRDDAVCQACIVSCQSAVCNE